MRPLLRVCGLHFKVVLPTFSTLRSINLYPMMKETHANSLPKFKPVVYSIFHIVSLLLWEAIPGLILPATENRQGSSLEHTRRSPVFQNRSFHALRYSSIPPFILSPSLPKIPANAPDDVGENPPQHNLHQAHRLTSLHPPQPRSIATSRQAS